MSNYNILCILLLQFLPALLLGQTTLMSFNIRYNNPNDGDNQWEYRKQHIVDMVTFYSPDIMGIQEGLQDQVRYLDTHLVEYKFVGVGRDDGATQGEYAAILYNTTKFRVLSSRTYWLSETPDKVSVGWDASMERIATFAQFLHKETKDTLYVFNCHFDHRGAEARKQSAVLITNLLKAQGLANQQVVVMGDLNCEPSEAPMTIFASMLEDSYRISQQKPYGPTGTWSSFDTATVATKRIDYILTKNSKVLQYAHIDDRRPGNLHLSDHLPVLVQID
ncbi:MAG: endonuclease/exonuclease/phosphatase family protein [Bacteroidota bacterium]